MPSYDVFDLAKKHFEKIKNKKAIIRNHMSEGKQKGKKEIIIKKDSKVEYIALAYHTPSFSDKSHFALSALADILSDGKTSRLHKVLVEEKKLFTSIYASDYALSNAGVFLFFGSCASGVLASKAKKALLEEIEKIRVEKITKKN